MQVESSSKVLEQLLTVLEAIVQFYLVYGRGRWLQDDDGVFVFSDLPQLQTQYNTFHRRVKYLLAGELRVGASDRDWPEGKGPETCCVSP